MHSDDDPLVHDLENVGGSTLRFVTVELKHWRTCRPVGLASPGCSVVSTRSISPLATNPPSLSRVACVVDGAISSR